MPQTFKLLGLSFPWTEIRYKQLPLVKAYSSAEG